MVRRSSDRLLHNGKGAIDKELTERKYSVTQIYDGFRYQIYAQYFALLEMGYEVEHLKIHSKKSNKNYPAQG